MQDDRSRALALVDETDLPLPDNSVDRVLLVHGVESSEYLRDLFREIWRVLSGDGRLIVVVPNRRGIWARVDRTPLGSGHPFSESLRRSLLAAARTAGIECVGDGVYAVTQGPRLETAAEIDRLERRKAEIERALSEPEMALNQIEQLSAEMARLLQEIETKTDRWMKLADLFE